MSDLDIKIKADQLQTRLGRLANIRTGVILDKLGAAMLEQNQARLDSEKLGPGGESWDPWSEDYAKSKGRGTMLEKSGALLESLAVERGSDAVSIGSNLLYAAVHLHGSDKQGIPARPYLGFSDDDMVELSDVVLSFFAKETQ